MPTPRNISVMSQEPEKTKGKVYILSIGQYEPEDETTEEELALMEQAYDILCKNEAVVRKVPMSKIVTLNKRTSGLSFVIPNFKCRAFHVLLKNEYRIYGPLAIIQSFHKIGRVLCVNFPLLSLNMYGAYLTITGLNEEEKNVLVKKCQWLGAEYDGNFMEMTTHLIAKECSTQSGKYLTASQRNTPVVMPSWIEEAYEAANNCDMVYSALENVENHLVPIFTNCVVSCSGLPPEERFKIAELVENNGGKFTKEMDRFGCTHLIIDSTTGAKYRHAIRWGNIHCVRLKWLLKCVALKRRLPENRYPPGQKTSTQVESNTTLNDPGLSAIVSTTIATTMSTNATLPSEAGLSKRMSNENVNLSHPFEEHEVVVAAGPNADEEVEIAAVNDDEPAPTNNSVNNAEMPDKSQSVQNDNENDFSVADDHNNSVADLEVSDAVPVAEERDLQNAEGEQDFDNVELELDDVVSTVHQQNELETESLPRIDRRVSRKSRATKSNSNQSLLYEDYIHGNRNFQFNISELDNLDFTETNVTAESMSITNLIVEGLHHAAKYTCANPDDYEEMISQDSVAVNRTEVCNLAMARQNLVDFNLDRSAISNLAPIEEHPPIVQKTVELIPEELRNRISRVTKSISEQQLNEEETRVESKTQESESSGIIEYQVVLKGKVAWENHMSTQDLARIPSKVQPKDSHPASEDPFFETQSLDPFRIMQMSKSKVVREKEIHIEKEVTIREDTEHHEEDNAECQKLENDEAGDEVGRFSSAPVSAPVDDSFNSSWPDLPVTVPLPKNKNRGFILGVCDTTETDTDRTDTYVGGLKTRRLPNQKLPSSEVSERVEEECNESVTLRRSQRKRKPIRYSDEDDSTVVKQKSKKSRTNTRKPSTSSEFSNSHIDECSTSVASSSRTSKSNNVPKVSVTSSRSGSSTGKSVGRPRKQKTSEEPSVTSHISPGKENSTVTVPSNTKKKKLDEDETISLNASVVPRTKNFILTSFEKEQKQNLTAMVRQLNGNVLDCAIDISLADSVVVGKFCRNEKLMSGIATGKRILHYSYIIDSARKGKWLDEDLYEFGNPKAKRIAVSDKESDKNVMSACHRWRLKIEATGKLAFDDWNVALYLDPAKAPNYVSIIKNGGGSVTVGSKNELLKNHKDFTYLIICSRNAMNYISVNELKKFAAAKVPFYDESFIMNYLTFIPPTKALELRHELHNDFHDQ